MFNNKFSFSGPFQKMNYPPVSTPFPPARRPVLSTPFPPAQRPQGVEFAPQNMQIGGGGMSPGALQQMAMMEQQKRRPNMMRQGMPQGMPQGRPQSMMPNMTQQPMSQNLQLGQLQPPVRQQFRIGGYRSPDIIPSPVYQPGVM